MRDHKVARCRFAMLALLSLCGCLRACPSGSDESSAVGRAWHELTGDSDAEHEGDAEERELQDELRERDKALAALAAYRAGTCADAIGRMEAALRMGKGRWAERDVQGAMPADLLTRLVEAEMWRDQAKPMCASDAAKPRFEQLRLLMDAIWRYPVTMPREELDKRSATLGD